jgi:hypothetical protein
MAIQKPNIKEIARLKNEYSGKFRSRDQVALAIKKLLKKRSQLLARKKISEARKAKKTKEQILKEEKLLERMAKSKRFDPHSIYYCTYKHPVTNPPIWDIRPLVIMLGISAGKRGNNLLAVNMHWIPRHYRYTFWNYIRTSYEYLKEIGKDRELPLLVYNDIKTIRQLRPAMKAIRKYVLSRIGRVVRVPEKDYENIFIKYKSLKKVVLQPNKDVLPTKKYNSGADMKKKKLKDLTNSRIGRTTKNTNKPRLKDLNNSKISRIGGKK